MKKFLACLGLAFILLLIGCGQTTGTPPPRTGNYPEEQTPIPTTSTPEESEIPIVTEPEKEPELILIKSWSGTGIKTTEPFIIGNKPWAINWISDPEIIDEQSIGILQIMVYSVNEPDIPIAIIANTQEAGTDTSYIYEMGEFFLTVNAANTSWKVYIFEPS
jgi:hypothetical protein